MDLSPLQWLSSAHLIKRNQCVPHIKMCLGKPTFYSAAPRNLPTTYTAGDEVRVCDQLEGSETDRTNTFARVPLAGESSDQVILMLLTTVTTVWREASRYLKQAECTPGHRTSLS